MSTFGSLLTGAGGARWKLTQVLLILLIIGSVLLGGTPNIPGLRMAVISLIACALAAWSVSHGAAEAFGRLPLISRLAILAFPLLWLLQLVPLPPGAWEALPGRDLARRVYDIIGTRAEYHPLSLTPADTLFGAVMLLPCLAAFLAALTLDRRGRQRCVAVFLGLVAISILIGLGQMSSRGALFTFHDSAHRANLVGFFANRNHAGLTMAIAGLFAIYVAGREVKRSRTAIGVSLVISLVLLTAAVGTTSRAGLGLTLIGLLAIFLAMFGREWPARRWGWLLASLALIAGLAYLLSLNPVVEKSLARFGAVGEDSRWLFWARSMPLLTQFYPWGGGLGGFVKLYNPVEPLDAVHPQYLNHAHNDYLEVLIEAGLPGIAALLLFAMALAVRTFRISRTQGWTSMDFALPAGLAIVLIAMHSTVDYPLRTQALAVWFGIMAAFFLADPAAEPENRDNQRLQGQGASQAGIDDDARIQQ